MKQFGLYLLYVGILFVVQMPFVLVRGFTDQSSFWKSGIGAFFEGIFFFLYLIPGAIIGSVVFSDIGVGTETRWWPGGIDLWFGFAVVALAYALLIGAVLWGITYIIIRIRDNSLKT